MEQKRSKEYFRQYRIKHKERLRKLARKWQVENKEYRNGYQLYRRHKNKELQKKEKIWHRNYQIKHREIILNKQKEQRRILKIEVLSHYSGSIPKCACCNENLLEFLTIDHIDGNGKKHRKEIKNIGGLHFYPWLKRNGYPKGFRVLCFNCNSATGAFGYCPHNKEGNK